MFGHGPHRLQSLRRVQTRWVAFSLGHFVWPLNNQNDPDTAVGLATLQYIEDENIVAQAASKGEYLLEQLHQALDGHPHVGNLRGKGVMCGVELVEDKANKTWYPPVCGVGAKMTWALIDHGVCTHVRSEVVCIAPPLTTDEATLDQLVSGVRAAVVDVFGE